MENLDYTGKEICLIPIVSKLCNELSTNEIENGNRKRVKQATTRPKPSMGFQLSEQILQASVFCCIGLFRKKILPSPHNEASHTAEMLFNLFCFTIRQEKVK